MINARARLRRIDRLLVLRRRRERLARRRLEELTGRVALLAGQLAALRGRLREAACLRAAPACAGHADGHGQGGAAGAMGCGTLAETVRLLRGAIEKRRAMLAQARKRQAAAGMLWQRSRGRCRAVEALRNRCMTRLAERRRRIEDDEAQDVFNARSFTAGRMG